MCLKLIFHNLACDVRPRVARSGYSSPIVNPYAAPNSCPQECRGKEHIAPYFRCLEHKCCMTSAEYVQTGCTSQCSPDRTTAYHVYTQWLGSTPIDVVVEQWEPLPTIDSYIPALRMAVPTTPAFREWRTSLLAKGSEVQQVLELMDLVETRLAEELQHKRAEHHICQRLDADWQKYRRFPNEPRPKECRNRENIEKLWKKLVQLSDLLKAAEIALARSQGDDPSASGVSLLDHDVNITGGEIESGSEEDEEDDADYEYEGRPDLTRAIGAGIALQVAITRADLAHELSRTRRGVLA